jgi:hypothetical protein
VSTPPASEEGEVENRVKVLTIEEEYKMMPKWRRDAAGKRVREMRAWMGIGGVKVGGREGMERRETCGLVDGTM